MTKLDLVNSTQKPGRLTAEQEGWSLGFEPGHIPLLTLAVLLKPLGQPAANGPKYFAPDYISRLSHDEVWLARASTALSIHKKTRNAQAKRNRLRRSKHDQYLEEYAVHEIKANSIQENLLALMREAYLGRCLVYLDIRGRNLETTNQLKNQNNHSQGRHAFCYAVRRRTWKTLGF